MAEVNGGGQVMPDQPEPTPADWACEPWRAGTLSSVIEDAQGRIVGVCYHAPTYKGDRRRILACVNACRGIPTEALEAMAKKDALGLLWRDLLEDAFNRR